MITFNNYHIATEALFKGCKVPRREPDFISNSGSKYWQQENERGKYIIRLSDHWVNIKELQDNKIHKDCNNIASCVWHIKTNNIEYCFLMNIQGKRVQVVKNPTAGKCYLKDFKRLI